MRHYRSNVRDLEFTLFEVLDRGKVLGQEPFGDLDEGTARDVLRQVARLAEEQLAPSLLESDRTPPVLDPATGQVSMPESFVGSYRAWVDAEWWRLELSAELGGAAAPPSLGWAVSELALGANPAVKMYAAGFTFAEVLYQLGTAEQQRLAELMVEHRWGATMVLTEPDAGSDVGAGRTRARDAGDGSWWLTGVKRFITSGTAPFYDNVVHFVLARPEGAGPGTKGLSLFLVPQRHVDLATGELGERNGVDVTGIEHKMGLKVSTTCELHFGEDPARPAVGYLVGGVHDGIAQMFRIIEYARMLVGTKAIATLSTGYLNALDYARQRVQGGDLARTGDRHAPRVTITHHPDVRRSLMLQKSYAEGLRALMLYTACQQDTVRAAQLATGREEVEPGSEADAARRLNDLLLPVVKGCGSERAWALLGTESLQTLGGSGFLQDHPLEQYVRDAKIDSLYEGTTAIQALDLFFRKIVRDRGVALGQLASEITVTLRRAPDDDPLATERARVGQALQDVQAMVEHLLGRARAWQTGGPEDPEAAGAVYEVGLHTTRLLLAVGDLVVGWLLLRSAEVAAAALAQDPGGSDADFYRGKLAAARFFTREVLPRLSADRATVLDSDSELLALPESAF
ncbi:acyl-CoA dehydrogenase [Ornithinicoccus halotolerans]|uniref:acyl-CoA dehydrogenase n=1 Tax=Ornithinicoccus halotolerans TaxID=1748220 RepID=UPI001294DFA0|nr:acyl-CoA dehydrogenase [Ornithinicoccus halotolerans]